MSASITDRLEDKLKQFPNIRYERSGDYICVPATDGSGFPVSYDGETVSYTGWHEHFGDDDESAEGVENCFGFGISDCCRLVILKKGDAAYSWTVEELSEEGNWEVYSKTALLFYAFWRRTTRVVLQNHHRRRKKITSEITPSPPPDPASSPAPSSSAS
ncbi:MAG TPA: hypothetical protein VK970_10245 [Candidatus Methylacidiphilales bacterium]|nr:hypothetical protein [Candidatus Methylacidiphilales bacterium]